jgi:hypothetical protein
MQTVRSARGLLDCSSLWPVLFRRRSLACSPVHLTIHPFIHFHSVTFTFKSSYSHSLPSSSSSSSSSSSLSLHHRLSTPASPPAPPAHLKSTTTNQPTHPSAYPYETRARTHALDLTLRRECRGQQNAPSPTAPPAISYACSSSSSSLGLSCITYIIAPKPRHPPTREEGEEAAAAKRRATQR